MSRERRRGRARRCSARRRPARPRRCRRCPGAGRTAAPPGRPHAEPGQRAGHRVEVPGEVLAAHALLGVGERARRRAPTIDGRPLHGHGVGVVDHRRHAARVVDLAPARRSAPRSASTSSRDQRLGRRPTRRGRAPAACRAAGRSSGSRWPRGRPRPRPTPATSPARGSTRRDSSAGQLGDQPAERVDQVDGQVRTGGVPARAGRA